MTRKAPSLDEFVDDAPWENTTGPQKTYGIDPLIEGVIVDPLIKHSDDRGELIELLTTRDGPIDPIVHVYQVFAEPQSIRAWVYHKRQDDRLAYTNGRFKVVLCDLRPDSGTYGMVNEFDLGSDFPCVLTIPPFVVHGVMNVGDERASFVNLPTVAYDPASPDKSRLPADHPGIPYSFSSLLKP